MRLQYKIPLIFFSLALLLGAPLLINVKKSVHRTLLQDLERSGILRASDVADSSLEGFETRSEIRLLPHLQSARARVGALYAVALSPHGDVLAHTNVGEKGKVYTDPLTQQALRAPVAIAQLEELPDGPIMDIAVPVWAAAQTNAGEEFLLGGGGEPAPRIRLGTVRLGLPLNEILDTQYRLFKRIALIVLVTGVTGLVLILLLMRHLLLPIKFLSEATSRIRRGDYGVDVPITSNDELGHLADDFNRMKTTLAETTVSKDYLSGVLDNLADPLIVMTADEVIRDVNPAALHMLGYAQSDLLGKPLEVLCPENSPLKLSENDLRMRTSILRNLEVDFRAKHGESIPVLLSSSVQRDATGQVADIIVTVKDMTERKRLEGIVRQSDKMSAVGQLAAGVAHEINNPLGVILGFVETIEQDMKPADPLQEPMKAIIREALRCKNLVQNLLAFSRERRPGMRQEDAVTVVENALTLVETQARVRGVEVVRAFAAPLPLTHMDRSQIEQVVINLCTNAMDAMPEGGRLTVGLAAGGTSWLEIRVADTGTGIVPEIQQRIFEPFFSTKEIGKGTGLGLSIVYDTIKKHHGTVEVKSEPGKGTVFIIRLPIKPVEAGLTDD